ELVHSALIPKHEGKGTKFRDITKDDVTMSAVFEQFVRNFFRSEGFDAARTTIRWLAIAEKSENARFLPVMQTDVTLTLKNVTTVIDTKFYWQALVKRFDVGHEKIRSGHLNQMYAYLKNFPLPTSEQLEGILLYPKVRQALDLSYLMGNLRLRIRTLD